MRFSCMPLMQSPGDPGPSLTGHSAGMKRPEGQHKPVPVGTPAASWTLFTRVLAYRAPHSIPRHTPPSACVVQSSLLTEEVVFHIGFADGTLSMIIFRE